MSLRILFLEHDDDLRNAYHHFFGRNGLETFGAIDADHCLQRINDCQPDVAIIEPELLSDDDLRAIGDALSIGGVKTFVVTRMTDPFSLPTELKIEGYFVKPVSLMQIEVLIQEAIEADRNVAMAG